MTDLEESSSIEFYKIIIKKIFFILIIEKQITEL